MPVRMARRMGDGEESDAGEATSAKERSQHTIHHKAHVSIVKEWARKAAAAGLKVKWSRLNQIRKCVHV